MGVIELEVEVPLEAAVFFFPFVEVELLDQVEGPGGGGFGEVDREAAIGTRAEEIGHGAAGLAAEAVGDLLGPHGLLEEAGPDLLQDLFFAEVLGADGGEDLAAAAVAGSFGGGGGVEIEQVL